MKWAKGDSFSLLINDQKDMSTCLNIKALSFQLTVITNIQIIKTHRQLEQAKEHKRCLFYQMVKYFRSTYKVKLLLGLRLIFFTLLQMMSCRQQKETYVFVTWQCVAHN